MSALRKLFGIGSNKSAVNTQSKPAIKLVKSSDEKEQLGAGIRLISNANDLPKFADTLSHKVKLAGEYQHKVCPVLVDANSNQFALIFDEGSRGNDLLISVKDHLIDLGYKPAETWGYVVPYSIVMDIVKNGVAKKPQNLNAEGANSPYYMLFENIARFAIENNASDIHFEIDLTSATSSVRFCIDGKKIVVENFNTASNELLRCIGYMYNNHGKGVSEAVFNQNFGQQADINLRIANKNYVFRYASTPDAKGVLVVMRIIEIDQVGDTRSYRELGYLPDQIREIELAASKPKGSILFCGRVGSGKSTSQHAILAEMPPTKSIITIEDPVEKILHNATQVNISRTLNDTKDSFLAIKRAVKRLNPNVVACGEIRDAQTAELFKDIVEAGLLGFGTLHCASVVEALTLRLVSKQLNIGREVIATPDLITLIIFQALIRKLCAHCNIPAADVYDDDYLTKIETVFPGLDRKNMRAANKNGCPHCRREYSPEFNGFSGRLVVAEMLRPTYRILRLIREARNIEIAQQFSIMRGEEDFASPSTKGKTALEVAMYHVNQGTFDPKEVEAELGTFDDYLLTKMGQIDV